MDTLEGIALCWLRVSSKEQVLVKVERAISFLVSKKLILKKRRKGLPIYYGLNHKKCDEIFALIQVMKRTSGAN